MELCNAQTAQFGARVQLIVQMIQPPNPLTPGVIVPVNLVGATNLSIILGYPDNVTVQVFAAALLTDGTDGKIVYTTVANVDLVQSGVFRIQGAATLAGNLLPPTEVGYLKVLPNIIVLGGPPMNVSPSAVILFDTSNVRWAGTVNANGVISWVAQPVPYGIFLQFTSLVMKDQSGLYHTITISTLGVQSGTVGGAFVNALDYFFMNDINGKTWVITVNESGILVAA